MKTRYMMNQANRPPQSENDRDRIGIRLSNSALTDRNSSLLKNTWSMISSCSKPKENGTLETCPTFFNRLIGNSHATVENFATVRMDLRLGEGTGVGLTGPTKASFLRLSLQPGEECVADLVVARGGRMDSVGLAGEFDVGCGVRGD